jgi:DNA-binding NarL/FixJ family response regulator
MEPTAPLASSAPVPPKHRATAGDRISLVLADAHPIVLRGMQHLFQGERDLKVLACCTDADETLAAVERHRPAILVLGFNLPDRGGLALLGHLSTRGIATRVVLLTGAVTNDEITEALRLGVRGVVMKEMPPDLLVKCIRQVNHGAMWIENTSALAVVTRMLRRESELQKLRSSLTRREFQLLQLVAIGLRNNDIAGRLNITEGTIKIHLHSIYKKLGVRDRLELVLLARERASA